MSGPHPAILAAGGVVVRRSGTDVEVLLVHRPRYADWSLPKGHLEPGEGAAAAAVREVHEETGVRAAVLEPCGSSTYPVGTATKEVRWFLMRPLDGDPGSREPDEEVDVARWVARADLDGLLTHASDRSVVTSALARMGTTPPRLGR